MPQRPGARRVGDLTGDFCASEMETGKQKGVRKMPKKTFTPEQIVGKLRQIEVLVSQGKTVPQACKEAGIVDQTFYRWRREYGGFQIEQAKDERATAGECTAPTCGGRSDGGKPSFERHRSGNF